MFENSAEFTAFGAYSEKFIDFLVNSKYEVWDITSQNDIYSAKTKPYRYFAIARAAKKFRVRTKVIKRNGIYFALRRYRKRIGILAGLLAFFAIIVIMSNFIWSIRITGNSEVTNYQIMEQLNLCGIKSGTYIRGFNPNEAELKLSLALEKLAWISIERTGSRLNVKVSERTGADDDFNFENEISISSPCNIVAARSGVLIETEIYKGRLLYEKGSGINKGDIIVSGVVSNGIGGLNFVHADAKLLAEIEETIEFYQPLEALQTSKNGKSDVVNSIIFLGLRFGKSAPEYYGSEHSIEYSEIYKAPKIFGFPAPFRVLTQKYVYYDKTLVETSAPYALEKLNRQIELYEDNFFKNSPNVSEVVSKEIEYFPDDNGIGAAVKYVFITDVAEKREILTK